MAKKIKVGKCKPGHFYKIRGDERLFFCSYVEEEYQRAGFQLVGSSFRVTVMYEKVKPVVIAIVV